MQTHATAAIPALLSTPLLLHTTHNKNLASNWQRWFKASLCFTSCHCFSLCPEHISKYFPNTSIKKKTQNPTPQIIYSPLQYLLNLCHGQTFPEASPLIHLHMGTYLHPYGLEESRVSEGKFHHLFDLSQLLPAATNVIIAHFIQWLLFILPRMKYIKHLSENNSSTTPPRLQKPGIWLFRHFLPVLRFSLSSLPDVFYNCFLALSSQT